MYMDGMGSTGEAFFHEYRSYYIYLFYTMFEWSYCGQVKNQGKFSSLQNKTNITQSLLVIKFQF